MQIALMLMKLTHFNQIQNIRLITEQSDSIDIRKADWIAGYDSMDGFSILDPRSPDIDNIGKCGEN